MKSKRVDHHKTREEARARIKALGEPFKLEILDSIKTEPITLYHVGDQWWDLCAGPHVETTGERSRTRPLLLPKAAAPDNVRGLHETAPGGGRVGPCNRWIDLLPNSFQRLVGGGGWTVATEMDLNVVVRLWGLPGSGGAHDLTSPDEGGVKLAEWCRSNGVWGEMLLGPPPPHTSRGTGTCFRDSKANTQTTGLTENDSRSECGCRLIDPWRSDESPIPSVRVVLCRRAVGYVSSRSRETTYQ